MLLKAKDFVLLFILILKFFSVQSQALDSSNLPIIILNTNNQIIPDGSKITANIKLISNASGMNHPGDVPYFNGQVGIGIRGRYSATLPQKPYGFETRDALGNNLNVSLLNMPAENDWILMANYNDKSFIRNSLAFQIFRNMGHYAPRSKLCEFVLNESYDGIYLLTEKIKRDNERLDISKLDSDDNAGDSISGGYIIAIDYYSANDSWQGNFPVGYPSKYVYFTYYYPAFDEITTQQKLYIQNYIKNFESVLYGGNFKNASSGYRVFVDLESFMDYFIINELARNVDGYKKSCFYYKNAISKGGRLAAGPVWDFDWAWKDIWDCAIFQNTDGSGWAYNVAECNPWPTPTGWIPRMMQDPLFVEQLHNRYSFLRKNIISNSSLNNYIDSVKTLVVDAQKRHYQRWNILGINVGSPEIGSPASTYAEEMEKLRSWISLRLNWLDAQMLVTSDDILDSGLKSFCRISPNPARNFVFIEAEKNIKQIAVYNLIGQVVIQKLGISETNITVDVSNLNPGIYIIEILFSEGNRVTKKLMVE